MDDVATPAQRPTAPALRLDHISISAATQFGRLTVVDDLCLDLYPGVITGLVGESGSGKSVTALAAMQLLAGTSLRLSSGAILLGEERLDRLGSRELRTVRGDRIAMVFQEPMTSLDPVFRVGSLLCEVIRAHRKVSKREARQQAITLLGQVGIPSPEKRIDDYPFQFSGGMRQRVLLAMAMACRPKVLIADEPTTALDVTVQAQILDLLRLITSKTAVAVLLVTHDLGVVSENCDEIAVMYAGQLVETGPTAAVLASPAHPYTEALLASIPSSDPSMGALTMIDGTVPALNEMPPGCRFAPRCAYADTQCLDPVSPTIIVGVGGEADRTVRCTRIGELVLRGVAG